MKIQLYEDGQIVKAACWSHARRKVWDIHERQHRLPGTLAHQALERIGRIFQVEAEISGRPPEERRQIRQQRTAPMLQDLLAWMNATLAQVSAKSPMALATGYSLSHWTALTRFVDNGRIDAYNNAAERALRGVAIGRKKYLHMGSDAGGQSAAVIYTLLETARLGGITPSFTCAMCWSGLPTTRATALTTCCHGTWRLSSVRPGTKRTKRRRGP